jgi:cell division protein FtsI (penicillin-binding protein 3)
MILLLYAGLSLRLAQIQIIQGGQWQRKGVEQRAGREVIQGQRGSITDHNDVPLVMNAPRDTVIADLKLLKDENARRTIAETLAPLLQLPAKTLLDKMLRDDRRIVYLARDVEPDQAEKIRALKLPGVGFLDEFRRVYPQGPLGCHFIGWAGVDGGMEGLELELNSLLNGTPGYLGYYRDAAHRFIALDDGAIGPVSSRPPRDGLAVTTTIDVRIQQVAEEELAHIMQEYQPKSATCVVMDVRTGAILAMACTPQFDPNQPAKAPPEDRRNRVVTDLYEPGSTFKTFVLSMSLEKKIWQRNERIFCENGAWNLGHRVLHDAHAYGWLIVDDVIAKSSNIGAAKIGLRLGAQSLHDAAVAFGFGLPTRVALPGEAGGVVHPLNKWSRDSVISVSMGHEVAVTPMQLAAAFAAVVNGGILYRPKIVQKIINEHGEELYTLQPQPVRRVISPETSAQMREVLTRVVAPGGTGARAFCAEWPILGKTGTSRKINPATKTYSDTLYVASFCGAAPADNPRLVCLVTADEPHKSSGYYGGTVCCPAVREVLRKGLSVLNVPPRTADEQKKALADFKRLATGEHEGNDGRQIANGR